MGMGMMSSGQQAGFDAKSAYAQEKEALAVFKHKWELDNVRKTTVCRGVSEVFMCTKHCLHSMHCTLQHFKPCLTTASRTIYVLCHHVGYPSAQN